MFSNDTLYCEVASLVVCTRRERRSALVIYPSRMRNHENCECLSSVGSLVLETLDAAEQEFKLPVSGAGNILGNFCREVSISSLWKDTSSLTVSRTVDRAESQATLSVRSAQDTTTGVIGPWNGASLVRNGVECTCVRHKERLGWWLLETLGTVPCQVLISNQSAV
jgi:hypothetical protein